MKRIAALAFLGVCTFAPPAAAWGTRGHLIVSGAAARELAGRVPAFMTTAQASSEIRYLGPEEDRLKGSGLSWDADDDPGHYLDLRDDGTIAGVVALDALPDSREAYDTALHAANTDQYRQGFLPYEILDGWEQLRDDFAHWRADSGNAAARAIDQQLVLRDAGVWSHFVGDGSQPLHVTVHFNGWGRYPNPHGFTQSRETHAYFETSFVNRFASQQQVSALSAAAPFLPMPAALLPQSAVMHEVERYLLSTAKTVPQLYAIQKAGGFQNGSPQAVRFVDDRLAAGVAEVRNLVVWAWQDSAYVRLYERRRSGSAT
jgi:hypothetical protein